MRMGRSGRSTRWLFLLAWLIGTAAVLGASPAASAAEEPDRVAAAELLVLVNVERASAGLAPVLPSPLAAEVAEAWSKVMADADDLAHNDAWFTPASRQRVGAGAVGENVAMNVEVADAHRRLMLSPGHRANILDPRFDHVGIGIVRGGGTWWITQDFFQLRSVPQALAPAPAPAPPAAAPAPAPPRPKPPAPAPRPAPAAPAPAPAAPPAPPAPAAPDIAPEPRELPASDPSPDGGEDAVASRPATLALQSRDVDRDSSPSVPRAIAVAAVLLVVGNGIRLASLRRG